MQQTLANMPETARLWVYGFDQVLSSDHTREIEETLSAFVASWHSHEFPVVGTYAIRDDRFVLISGFCEDGISGCSADSSFHVIKNLNEKLGVDGLNTSLVYFRDTSGAITSVSREAFQEIVNRGEVTDETTVFDLTVNTVKDLRDRKIEKSYASSWHSRAFSRKQLSD